MIKATWENIELTTEGVGDIENPLDLNTYRVHGWEPEELVKNGYARITQPAFIDGAEYWLKPTNGIGQMVKVRYCLNTNTFNDELCKTSTSVSDFGIKFTVELVPVNTEQLIEDVKSGGRTVNNARAILAATTSTPPIKPPLLEVSEKLIKSSFAYLGPLDFKPNALNKAFNELSELLNIKCKHNPKDELITLQKPMSKGLPELARYLGFSSEFNEGDVLSHALSVIKKLQEPDEFYLKLRSVLGDDEGTDAEILDDYQSTKRGLETTAGKFIELNSVCNKYSIGKPGDCVTDSVIEYIEKTQTVLSGLRELLGRVDTKPVSLNKIRKSMGLTPTEGVGANGENTRTEFLKSDYITHHHDWLNACIAMRDQVGMYEGDEAIAHRTYWQKQIDTLNRLERDYK